MTDRITSLLSDLGRLVQELDVPSKAVALKEANKEVRPSKKEVRPLEGQILTLEPNTVLASRLRNAAVSSPDEKTIGEVTDLIIKANGHVTGVVICVGGDKNVAIKLERCTMTPAPNGAAHIMLRAKKEELQNAPAFNPAVEQ